MTLDEVLGRPVEGKWTGSRSGSTGSNISSRRQGRGVAGVRRTAQQTRQLVNGWIDLDSFHNEERNTLEAFDANTNGRLDAGEVICLYA